MIERYTLPRMKEVWSERSKFDKMLQIEILSCEGLAILKKIPSKAAVAIRKKARYNIRRIEAIEAETKHDVVAFVNNVSESLGGYARYFHMGLTSNDILDTSLALQMVEASDIILEDIDALIKILRKKAHQYEETVCIGRTHGVHAEPVTMGLKFALWFDEMRRNRKRLEDARENIGVGKLSGAVGTYSNIDPFVEDYVCKKLNLKVSCASTQVISRDRHAQYFLSLALIGSSLEKIATEIRHLQKTEVLEAEEPFSENQKGSSAMPHKRNPILCERICGLARLLRTNACAALENVALWHERDISHSSVERVILPDSTIIADYILHLTIEVLGGLVVYPENMLHNLGKTRGLIFSQCVLIALMNKGLKRPDAYDLVQKASMTVWKTGKHFKDVLCSDQKIRSRMSQDEIEECFDVKTYLKHIKTIFKRIGV